MFIVHQHGMIMVDSILMEFDVSEKGCFLNIDGHGSKAACVLPFDNFLGEIALDDEFEFSNDTHVILAEVDRDTTTVSKDPNIIGK